MAARLSSLLPGASLVAVAVLSLGVAGCDKTHEATATPSDAPAPPELQAAHDPGAPAPGTQAAEAIGVDSSTHGVVTRPDPRRP